jgi:hypothetical protein
MLVIFKAFYIFKLKNMKNIIFNEKCKTYIKTLMKFEQQ